MIDFEIDSILGDGDVEDLMLVSFAAPMPHGFGFCEPVTVEELERRKAAGG